MKKLINRPEDVVREELAGIALAHAGRLVVHTDPHWIARADAPVAGKVAIVSGGGSGHEPMHGGFVGPGMLDAACPGEVFTSPTPDQMLAATQAVDGGAGALHIVKNYTGDVMNFEMAADLARDEGLTVEQVVIDDDVAVKDSLYTAGRRGVGATVLAEKICGAAAEAGPAARRGGRPLPHSQRAQPQHGRGADLVHHAHGGQADVRPRRRRDGGRRRHPRRARARAAAAGHAPARSSRRSPRAVVEDLPFAERRPGARLRQRHGRHAAHGAVRRLPRAAPVPRRSAASRSRATSSAPT